MAELSRRYARVIRVEFDNMENSYFAALREETAVVFADDERGNAADKASEWVALLTNEQYTGWDKKIYPQYRVEEGVLS